MIDAQLDHSQNIIGIVLAQQHPTTAHIANVQLGQVEQGEGDARADRQLLVDVVQLVDNRLMLLRDFILTDSLQLALQARLFGQNRVDRFHVALFGGNECLSGDHLNELKSL